MPDDILNEISKISNLTENNFDKPNSTPPKRKSKKLKVVKKIKYRFVESDLPKSAVSDFIPLKSYK